MRDDLKGYNGPRVIINPAVMHDDRDAMCVAWNETFRILMEANGFDPQSEPTEKQREFFVDTAYANDERMLRRTILARICTFDTSVKDPTDEQLQEAVEFLDTVMEIGAPQNEWEQRSVQRIRDVLARTEGAPAAGGSAPKAQGDGGTGARALDAGGKTDENGFKEAARRERERQMRAMNAYNDNGIWRTQTGKPIGNDAAADAFVASTNALRGTGAYFDGNGTWRTAGNGFRIAQRDIGTFAEIRKATAGTGAFYQDGRWNSVDGSALDVSKWQKPKDNFGQPPPEENPPQQPDQPKQPEQQPQQPQQTAERKNDPGTGTKSGVVKNGRELTAAEAEFERNRAEGEKKAKHRDLLPGENVESESQRRHREERAAVLAERRRDREERNA